MQNALILCRLAHFAATMLLVGAGAFVWALAPAGLARLLGRPVRLMTAIAIPGAAVSAIAWLSLEAAELGDGWSDAVDPTTLSAVLADTEFGQVWQWRLGLIALLLVVLALGRHDRWAFVVPTAALLLASLGLVGHSNLQGGVVGALHKTNHALHLLVAGLWFGGLPPFILSLMRSGEPGMRLEVGIALRRFSASGHVVVALVLLTGIVNTALTLGAAPLPLASPYQSLLAAKIGLVAAMIAIALFNRYRLAPLLKSDTGAALRALTINSIGELVLGCCVLALVSVFGLLAPV